MIIITMLIIMMIIIIIIIPLKLIYDKIMDKYIFIGICMHSGKTGIYFLLVVSICKVESLLVIFFPFFN